jgi:hypothetical protein
LGVFLAARLRGFFGAIAMSSNPKCTCWVRVWLKNQIHYAGAYSLKPLSKSLVVRAKHSFSQYLIAGARRTVA